MNCACGNQLGPRNKSGECRTCSARRTCAAMNADPANKAKRRATVDKWTPEFKMAKVTHLHAREIPPDEVERRREAGLRLVREVLSRPEIKARRHAKRFVAGAKRTETTIGHIPAHRRDDYRALMQKHLSADEARAVIEADERASVRRTLAAMRERHRRDQAQRY